MFGRKKDESMNVSGDSQKDLDVGIPTPVPANRPAINPEIVRRPPDLSAYGPRTIAPTLAQRGQESEQKKLIVGKDIVVNGQIRTCDTLYVEGKVEAVLSDCKSMDIAASGEFSGSAEVEFADISGCFDGDLAVRSRLTIRASGRVLGKIRYAQLEVERGGVIAGQIEDLGDLAMGKGGKNAAAAPHQSQLQMAESH